MFSRCHHVTESVMITRKGDYQYRIEWLVCPFTFLRPTLATSAARLIQSAETVTPRELHNHGIFTQNTNYV